MSCAVQVQAPTMAPAGTAQFSQFQQWQASQQQYQQPQATQQQQQYAEFLRFQEWQRAQQQQAHFAATQNQQYTMPTQPMQGSPGIYQPPMNQNPALYQQQQQPVQQVQPTQPAQQPVQQAQKPDNSTKQSSGGGCNLCSVFSAVGSLADSIKQNSGKVQSAFAEASGLVSALKSCSG